MKTLIKICGIRRVEDVGYINTHRPDYAGFILTQGFRRSITPERFCELKGCLDDEIKAVGVFVNEPLETIVRGRFADVLDVIQLHGDEDEGYITALREVFGGEIWKAVRAKSSADIEYADRLPCDRLLIDSFVTGRIGGTGKTADTGIIKAARITKPFLAAGGISKDNAAGIIKELSPFGADISSSVETDGIKDENKIRDIIRTIREVV